MRPRTPKAEVRGVAVRGLFIEIGRCSVARLAHEAVQRGICTPGSAEAQCRAALKAITPDGVPFAVRVSRMRGGRR